MQKTLTKLDFEPNPQIDNLIRLSLAVQEQRADHPDAAKRSATRGLTRSAVLYALGELDPRVRKVFEEARMDWPSFQDLLGLDKVPATSPRTDAPLDSDLREALVDFKRKYPERKSIDLPAIALAVVDSVRTRPRDGRLPNRLGKLGVDLKLVHSRLESFARESANEPVFVATEAEEALLPGPTLSPESLASQQEDRVPTLVDDPSHVDWLNRRPFAKVIATRIREIWKGSPGKSAQLDPGTPESKDKNRRDSSKAAVERSFAVHIHGPWGAGKTSVLNFLRKELVESGSMGPPWVVIDFNAWRHQRIRPPWWPLIRQVYQQALVELERKKDHWASSKLQWHWLVWRMRADWLPIALAALVIFLILRFVGVVPAGASGPDKVLSDTGLRVVIALLTAWAGILAFGRSMLLGSAKAAQSYMDLAQDPMGPIADLFEDLVQAVGRPLVIFIDDLDRCDGDYVVELLEGIQTLFRRAQITYVVTADRDWIRTSFEKKYSDFTAAISEPGRPLGYLFLEKLFQVSATLPQLSPTLRASYWDNLLKAAVTATTQHIEEVARQAEEKAKTLLHEKMAPEEMERVINEHKDNPVQQQGLRAVAAVLISTRAAEQQRAHFLQAFAGLLEPNPRAMKRLINAYGIHQSVNVLEGRQVDSGALALWTIIEMRWPLLADCLADSPDLVSQIGKNKPKDGRIPEGLRDLFMSSLVHKVVKGEGVEPTISLDAEAIERVVGTSQSESGAGSR